MSSVRYFDTYLRDFGSRSDIPDGHDPTRILTPPFTHVLYTLIGKKQREILVNFGHHDLIMIFRDASLALVGTGTLRSSRDEAYYVYRADWLAGSAGLTRGKTITFSIAAIFHCPSQLLATNSLCICHSFLAMLLWSRVRGFQKSALARDIERGLITQISRMIPCDT